MQALVQAPPTGPLLDPSSEWKLVPNQLELVICKETFSLTPGIDF